MTQKTRYYLHGDLNDEGFFYCARCDVFRGLDHLNDGTHNGGLQEEYKRYHLMRKHWNKSNNNSLWIRDYFRPENSKNILE